MRWTRGLNEWKILAWEIWILNISSPEEIPKCLHKIKSRDLARKRFSSNYNCNERTREFVRMSIYVRANVLPNSSFFITYESLGAIKLKYVLLLWFIQTNFWPSLSQDTQNLIKIHSKNCNVYTKTEWTTRLLNTTMT